MNPPARVRTPDFPLSCCCMTAPENSAPAALTTTDLTHRYGDRVALDHLSLRVAPREIFGLLGPNGGGKTTLFRILSTLVPPSGGRALIFGHDVVREAREVRRSIG